MRSRIGSGCQGKWFENSDLHLSFLVMISLLGGMLWRILPGVSGTNWVSGAFSNVIGSEAV